MRTGINVGRPTSGDGTVVVGTDAAIREEMRAVLTATRGKVGKELKRNVKVLQRAYRESHEWGSAKQAMERFGYIAEELGYASD